MSDWQRLLDPDIHAFIRAHEGADVAALALKKPPVEGWPYKLILDQIKARQKAIKKIPSWLEIPDVIFPPAGVMEQASSEATARFKASLVQGDRFLDLTGGGGVDSWAFSKVFARGDVVENDAETAARLTHNLTRLAPGRAFMHHQSAEEFLQNATDSFDLIYIDPQRRDNGSKGLKFFDDCSPNILKLLPRISEMSQHIVIKASPMLDLMQGIGELGRTVTDVFCIEWDGQCKEVLFLLKNDMSIEPENVCIHGVKLDHDGTPLHHIQSSLAEEKDATPSLSDPLSYLYEAGPAFLKTGLHGQIGENYGLQKLHPHTHLYTSDKLIKAFPGRIFAVKGVLKASAQSVPFKKANLTIRNFPETVTNLRKKLKLREGGSDYLFACTLQDESKALIHGNKIPQKGL